MADSRAALLARVLEVAATGGLADRSLREIAAAAGTSHRMLLYHFGSREGLLAAVVGAVEAQQRAALQAIAADAADGADVVRRLWAAVSAPELRPAVALFFEVVAAAAQGRPGTEGFLSSVTTAWLEEAAADAAAVGEAGDVVDMRVGTAVVRGLLIDVLADGDAGAATAALDRFVERYLEGTGSELGR